MRAADYFAVVTSTAKVTTGPNDGQGMAYCAFCHGPIATGTIIHRLVPKRGGSHVYAHQGCWP
jgi:cytochrome c553